MTEQEFKELMDNAPLNANIQKYLMVTRNKLSEYRRIAVSYSGGSDSDIVLDLIELVKPDDCGEIKYVFFDTGLEWDATHRHVSEVEQRCGVNIERCKAKVSIPAACAKHGVPFFTKDVSAKISALQKHNFAWNEISENATEEKYGRCMNTLDWFFSRRLGDSEKSQFSITHYKLLREFLRNNPPYFTISKKCCNYTKKNVSKEFNKTFAPDLCVSGMRKSEGGVRVSTYKNCFSLPNDKKEYAEYRPLWFWTDKDKQMYKEWRGIKYSDCYEKWGFKRTGCVGCPCSSSSVEQLKIAEPYEPNKVKAAYAVFGKSYEYREKYNQFKRQFPKI